MKSHGEWTEVRRRRTNETKRTFAAITTFFASKLPMNVQREEIRSKFAKYGEVTDVCLANKKDAGGNHFAFIRFLGVSNTKVLEKKLAEISYNGVPIAVNIARYQREYVKKQTDPKPRYQSIRTPQTAQTAPNSYIDRRTFAEVAAGTSVHAPNPPKSPPITLISTTTLSNWPNWQDDLPEKEVTDGNGGSKEHDAENWEREIQQPTSEEEPPVTEDGRRQEDGTTHNVGKHNEVKEIEKLINETVHEEVNGDDVVINEVNIPKSVKEKVGTFENWVSMGCFGPFPSTQNWPNHNQKATGSNEPTDKRGKKKRLKRRHADLDGKSCSPLGRSDF
ncbi:hypothetical protein L2E82_11585 [Cichorium intybus]|uniref:Uncharacterized protein n=1 Tax=Cichorium intybus TaxID=13427 RepID=A0ACB9GDK4_CICIN|nr:hypothetical protein L2E82_11585 [Cichorium intybus]